MRSEHGKPLTDWMGAMPRFSPDAPPKDWERQHARRLSRSALKNDRPVPRLASHHYAIDRLPVYAQHRDTRSTFVFA